MHTHTRKSIRDAGNVGQTCQPPQEKRPKGANNSNEKYNDVCQHAPACKDRLKFTGGFFTGQSSDTRRLVVAISLSGSAVNFSLTVDETKHITWNHCKLKDFSFSFLIDLSTVKATSITSNCSIKTATFNISWVWSHSASEWDTIPAPKLWGKCSFF